MWIFGGQHLGFEVYGGFKNGSGIFKGLFLLGGSGDEYLSILNGSDRKDRLVIE